MRPSFIEVDLSILTYNLKLIREHIANRPLMAVVKSNAYGHGLVRVAHLYEQLGVNSLGVALLEEGIILRKSGISLPIAVFGGVLKEQIPELLEWDLEFIVPSNDVLNDTEKFCKAQNQRATVHLKIDSCMGMIGTIAENSESLIASALDSKHINIKGVCSQFACADDPEDPKTLEQIDRFLEAVSVFEKLGASTPLRHIANSGGVLYFPQSHLDIVRPGIILYGVYPEPSCPRILELEPALKLKSKVSFHKSIPPGFSISYGATWTWTVFENDNNPSLEIMTNPNIGGINSSATVAMFTSLQAGQPWAGCESLHGADIGSFSFDSTNCIIKIMVWKDVISDVGIKFADATSAAQPEIKVANTLINQWEELTFDFSSRIGVYPVAKDQIIIFPDFELAGRTQDNICYFDNISFSPSKSVGVDNRSETLPQGFALEQNFPNPFNPITTLKYELLKDTYVDIIIYDMLGNVVYNLVNTNQSSGYKSVQWNATNNQGEPVSAGVYLYKIQAGNFVDTKKMILLK